MNFLYDEGLRDADGNQTYELVPHGLAPFSFEKLTLIQAMKDKDVPKLGCGFGHEGKYKSTLSVSKGGDCINYKEEEPEIRRIKKR